MKVDQYLTPGSSYTRLLEEYKKYGSLVIGYDFDGTVHDYHKKGETYDMVISLLRRLKALGFKCICWTAYPDLDYVQKYLDDNNIPCDGINSGGISLGWESKKPFFSALLDDRAGLLQVYSELNLLVETIEEELEGLTFK